ncbi:hypothetical protein Tsubulata_044890 [Turnera subulata]|uniref:Mediator of RNA polymerase II transcription subunit 1 n=1 Tax=Turnera subulata TaxID=218843 RepID=A0A9Q0JLH6_9ROSI|nr:hypothetical protein Tsubulata_044890 [Turnera subulata]
MEKSEPTLVPEWLRSTGNVSGGGSSLHHFASSSPHSDVSSSAHHLRNRSAKNGSDHDSSRLALLERTSSSNSRRSSSNGSSKHPYSSFSRSHRDKDRDRERDKERLSYGDHWDRDSSDPLGSILTSRGGKDTLRRSHSMVSRKQSEVFPRRVVPDLKNGSTVNHTNGNGLVSGSSVGNSIHKTVFEKDFPSLGGEERQGVPDIARVSSPGLSTAVQSLPVGSSALVSGEGWTSALAEVPTIIGSSTAGSLSAAQTTVATASGASSVSAGLNMAEALTQAPSKARTAPQLSVQTQRREELAIKQSKQLIPVTPLMPKSSVLNSSDKSKPRAAIRSSELNLVSKTVHQQPSSLHTAKQSHLGGPVKPDTPKTSHGKLFILKPGWENGTSPSPKDVASPTNTSGRAGNSQLGPPTTPSVPSRSSNNPKPTGERKSANLNLISGLNVEKRPLSQTQSRLDFFNHLKKKTTGSSASVLPDPSAALSSPTGDNPCKIKEGDSAPASQAIKNGVELAVNGGTFEEVQNLSEEDVNFLRSLGWEESGGDEGEGLTEEEINAFIAQYEKVKPSLKLYREQKLSESYGTGFDGASSALTSSDSGSET